MPATILQRATAVLGTRRSANGRTGLGSRKCGGSARTCDCVNTCSTCGHRQRFHCNCNSISDHGVKCSIYCHKCASNSNCSDTGCLWVGDRFHCNCSGGNNMRANARRSPRLGAGAGAKDNQPLLPFNSSKLSGCVLADITNITGKAEMDKKPKDGEVAVIDEQAKERQRVAGTEALAVKNVQDATEYVTDIIDNMFREESTFLPRADYMATQTDINGKMRAILIDWLVEVHLKYRLRRETLHLAVGLVDRYLSQASVKRNRLQLIGVVAMFIASKYEEIHPPGLQDFVYITDNAYSKDDVLNMECTLLDALSFQITVPTAAHFFPVLQKDNGCDSAHQHLAEYLLELGLLDASMLQYSPSHIVSSALLLSNELIGRKVAWPAEMARQSRYAEADIRECADLLRQLREDDRLGTGKLFAVHKKFSSSQRCGVATKSF